MNKTLTMPTIWNKSIFVALIMLATLVASIFWVEYANAAITMQLDLGDSNSEVTELQTYLSTNATIYPSGLVTGYFGQLTKAGVERFQATQGIVSQGTPATTGYGRVGPQTMARINSLMAGGYVPPSQVSWDTAPSFSNLNIQKSDNSATISWSTNEPTQGQVYYNDSPLGLTEATGPRQQPAVTGASVIDNGGLQTSHSLTLQNLKSDTTYYYLVRGIDNVGNMSMVWPSTFRTNN